MGIMITSKREGFRRAGIEHSETPTVYPDGRFTEAQLEALKAEQMLVVQDIEDPEGLTEMPWDKMSVPHLKQYAKEHGIELGEAKKRDEILAIIAEADNEDESTQ